MFPSLRLLCAFTGDGVACAVFDSGQETKITIIGPESIRWSLGLLADSKKLVGAELAFCTSQYDVR